MTYLLVGKQNLVDKELETLKKGILDTNIIKYDLEESSISDAILDLDTFSLFGDKKLVIVNNFDLLDKDDGFIKYLYNQNDNILVLISNNKLDERKKIVKEVKKRAKVIDLTNIDLFYYIKDSFLDYSIDNMTIMLLKDYCNDDYDKIKNEIEKLKMYKLSDKKILDSDVKCIVKKSFDSNIFDLLNAINKREKKKIFEVYYELIDNNDDELKILGVLANNFRLIYKIKELLLDKKDEEIIKYLEIHPYRFKILKEQSFNYNKDDVLDIIKNLGDVDIAIKSGKLDKKMAMELFLTKL